MDVAYVRKYRHMELNCKYQEKIRMFSQTKEKQDPFKKAGKNQESSLTAKPANMFHYDGIATQLRTSAAYCA
jgi:hypothetical protein